MPKYVQSDRSFEGIQEGKKRRREALMLAIGQASPAELEGPANRLREAMRKPEGQYRRQRMDPPAFSEE